MGTSWQGIESSWNVMAHGDAREGKWRGNWRMEWEASTLHTTRNMVYTALLPLTRTRRLPVVDWTDALRPIQMDSSLAPRDEIWFLRVCHHISNAFYIKASRMGKNTEVPVFNFCRPAASENCVLLGHYAASGNSLAKLPQLAILNPWRWDR